MDPEKRREDAARKARSLVLRHCASKIVKAMDAIDDALKASEVKTHFDPDGGKKRTGAWKYSKGLPNHSIRLQAAKVVVELAEAEPNKKLDITHSGSVISRELEEAARIKLEQMVKEIEEEP